MMKKVMDYIKQYKMIEEDDLVVVGVSGGADSLCLLLVLLEYRRQLPFALVVVHVNHGIRPEAGRDASFVEGVCKEYGIPFYLKEASVGLLAKEWKVSEEEAGRRVRYQAFAETAEQVRTEKTKGIRIAVAHHMGDRAETMLFHLFRGTGVWGMAGIRPVNGSIIRPLLGVTREEIEAWLVGQGRSWCMDATNEEDGYTRNKIRHHILDYANKEINTKATEHLAGAAAQMAEVREFLEEEIKKIFSVCAVREAGGIRIRISALQEYPEFLQKNFLLSALDEVSQGRRDITSVHIQSIRELMGRTGNGQVTLPGTIGVRKEYDDLRIALGLEEKTADRIQKNEIQTISLTQEGVYPVTAEEVLEITFFSPGDIGEIAENQYTKYFDYDKINNCLSLRYRQAGDYLMVYDGGGTKSLKEYFIHEKVPAVWRDRIPLIAEGKHILWVVGYRISSYYKISDSTKRVIQMTIRRKNHVRES